MITIQDVLVACEVRKKLAGSALINAMFIFETPASVGDGIGTTELHLYAEILPIRSISIQGIYAQAQRVLKRKKQYSLLTLASRGESVICPMCRERFAVRRFGAHIRNHKIRKIEIKDGLDKKSEAYIESRINALSKPVILPPFRKPRKRRSRSIFSGGAPGLGKKN